MNTLGKIEPRMIFDAVWRRLGMVFLCAALAGAAGGAGGKHIKAKNVSSAKLLIQNHDMVNPFLKDLMVDWSIKQRLPVITNIVRSRQTAEEVQRQLGVLKENASTEEVDAAVRDYQKRLSIYGLGGGVVQIKYEGRTPLAAVEGINLVVAIFTEEMLRPQKQALDSSVGFLGEQVSRVRAELDAKEDELRAFKEEHADELPEVYKANLDAYLKTQRARMEARAELSAKRQSLQIAKARLSTRDPVRQRIEGELARSRGELASLEATLSPRHPRVQAKRARVTELERELSTHARTARAPNRRELEALAAGSEVMVNGERQADLLTSDLLDYREAESEVGGLQRRVAMLDGETKAAIDRARSFARHARTLRALERDIESKSDSYVDLMGRKEEAIVTRALTLSGEASKVWLLEKPTMPSGKATVPAWVVALGALFGGAALGLAMCLGLELIDPTVRANGQAAEAVGARVLGVLPAMERRS